MFRKILIANRGEIAVRIARTCKRMNIKTVAVYSQVGSRSLHVREADESAYLGGSRPEESYLAKEKVIDAALAHGCQAIHPGYGFLSENAEFADMVAKAGLVFVGPPPEVITKLGDKMIAKTFAEKLGIPIKSGPKESLRSLPDAVRVSQQIGFPLMMRPARAGGGRGIRVVENKVNLRSAVEACQNEARKAFGCDDFFMERFIKRIRHIEIQIIADKYGNVVHLGERECSIQRRYQKIIEESPSVAVDEALRERMGEMACNLAREAGYTNAGTVEFILDDSDKSIYFLEMNTRLQVEHPVTEMVTHLDLVELQLRVAAGEKLPFRQKDIIRTGWAIEARICAEDPSRNFLPVTGMITRYATARVKNVRIDSSIEAGSFVSTHYDSLLAKVIAWGETRKEAIESLCQALNAYHIEGLITNVDFVNAVLNHPSFAAGDLSTDFIDEHFEHGQMKLPTPEEWLHYMAMAATIIYHNRQSLVHESLKPMMAKVGAPHHLKNQFTYMVKGDGAVFELRLIKNPAPLSWTIMVDGRKYQLVTPEFEFYRRRIKLRIDGETQFFHTKYKENNIWVAYRGATRVLGIYSPLEWELLYHMPKPKKVPPEDVVRCPMPGMVVTILVKNGDRIYRGQDLVSIESMKMESFVAAPSDGQVERIHVSPGQAVETGDILIKLKIDSASSEEELDIFYG
ncbi:MAG: biotin carboxylase N-terminal domain-containing protein [Syntrophaceae bacterium]